MKTRAHALLAMVLVARVAGAQAAAPADQPEVVTVTIAGLYGNWRMVLPDLPGFGKPVTGDYCSFKKDGDGLSIVCADDFLQDVPEVTLDGDKLHLRWGGALNHTTYDAVLQGDGSIDGELVQAQMGLVAHRFKAKMERMMEPAANAPRDTSGVVNSYFGDLAARSIREKTYEDDVVRAMKRAGPFDHTGFAAKYYGQILEEKAGEKPTYPDIFKVSNAAGAEQWCLVRLDAEGLADIRCRDIR